MSQLTHRNKQAALADADKLTGPEKFIVPELTVKDVLSVIPPHCFNRSALRSFSYVAMDFGLIAGIYRAASTLIPKINPTDLPISPAVLASLPPAVQNLVPHLYTFGRFAGWQIYGFATGLVATGLWVIAHECGHQARTVSLLAHHARQASRHDEPSDQRPGIRTQVAFSARFAASGPSQGGPGGLARRRKGARGALGRVG
ncbi:hypothetical protein FRC08_007496 [Ceratobasidium sp. 394]|nr:hypothetical protein FRC08_007496 [Ceratobasidium sp. 394]